MTKTKTKTMTMTKKLTKSDIQRTPSKSDHKNTMTKTLREHPQRMSLETCDI